MHEPFEIQILRLESGRFILDLDVGGHKVVLATTDAEQEAVAMKTALASILRRLLALS